jgi:hypothetical protein
MPLNQGRNRKTKVKAIKNEIITKTNDSPRKCIKTWVRFAPRTFLTPISLLFFIERAMERLMKLKLAIKSKKTAEIESK